MLAVCYCLLCNENESCATAGSTYVLNYYCRLYNENEPCAIA